MDVEGGKDLVPVTVWEVQNDSIVNIANECNNLVMKTKRNENKEHTDVTKIFLQLPTFILGFLTTVCSYLAQNAGIAIKALNVRYSLINLFLLQLKANAFGHIVLTNIGSLGIETGFAPIPCPTHCCIVACLGKVVKKPVVVDEQIVVRDMMQCVYTVDHRYGDAAILLQFLKIMKDILENPEEFNADKYPELPSYEELAKTKKTQ